MSDIINDKNRPIILGITLLIIFGLIFFIGFELPSGKSEIKIDKSGYSLAPEIRGIKGYINTDSNISLANLRGKVVLLDFWTYSCINCIRTIPYLNEWNEKYNDDGLVILGVHSPEFEFEKDYANVKNAVEEYEIKFPVILDNDFSTWRAYNNRFWPHKFLIDAEGYIRYDHIGEGSYSETEKEIVKLLKEASNKEIEEKNSQVEADNPDFGQINTPELYFGYDFARTPLGNSKGYQAEVDVNYTSPENLEENKIYLDGIWKNKSDYMELISEEGTIELIFSAKKVNIVAGVNKDTSIDTEINIYLDDKFNQRVLVSQEQLYNITNLEEYDTLRKVTINAKKGFRIYTFTFG